MTFTSARKERLRGILDSNALFVPLQFKIDVVSELERLLNRSFELIQLSPVKRELETLAEKGAPMMRKNARYALRLAEKCKYVEVEGSASTHADDVIVKIAGERRAPGVSYDRELREGG